MYFWIVLSAIFLIVASVGAVYWYAGHYKDPEDKS